MNPVPLSLQRVGRALALATFFFVFPFVFTLAYSGPEPVHTGLPESGRTILLEETGREVDLEEFVLYMVAAQMPINYEPAALQCQAVLARTYLYGELGDGLTAKGTDLKTEYRTDNDLLYRWGQDYTVNYHKLEEAVKQTAGVTLRYEGNYIHGVFHRVSAGKTRDGGGNFPYLKSRDCPEDVQAEGQLTILTCSGEELAARLNADAPLSSVQIVERDSAGYVTLVYVGAKTWQGDTFAEALGLPSPCFLVDELGDEMRFTCKGQGHGYGLSQWGANEKAKAGWNYMEILKFYFDGI